MSLTPFKLRQAAAYLDQPPPPTLPHPKEPLSKFLRDAADEIDRLQAALQGLIAWRNKSWSPKGITITGLPRCHLVGSDLAAEIDAARAETAAVWKAASDAVEQQGNDK